MTGICQSVIVRVCLPGVIVLFMVRGRCTAMFTGITGRDAIFPGVCWFIAVMDDRVTFTLIADSNIFTVTLPGLPCITAKRR